MLSIKPLARGKRRSSPTYPQDNHEDDTRDKSCETRQESSNEAARSTRGANERQEWPAQTQGRGSPAPSFSLPADSGGEVTLAGQKGKWVVLYFYPRDNTPGCTREAIAFQGAAAALKQRGAVVLGVSRDSIASHCGFKEKQGLRFPLLSDPDSKVHKLYGAYGDKVMYGKKVTGALRTTLLIAPDGRVARSSPT